jgi:MFS transporter, DHA1 family, tetracycline resistance protein
MIETPPPRTRPSSRRAVTFVFITVTLDMVGFGLIIPVMPALIGDVGHLGVADAALVSGWMFVVFSAMQFLTGPLLGNLSDAWGRRPLLLLAVLGLAVDYVIMALATSLVWLFIARAIAGVCGASYVIANAYIADITTDEERAHAFGLMGAAFGLGFIIGPAIGGLLGTFGPRVPFYAAATISALNLVYGYFVLPETLPPEKRRPLDLSRANPLGTFKVFRTYDTILPLCGVLAVYFFACAVYPAIWSFWGIAKFGWSKATIGLTLAAFGLGMALVQGFLTQPAVDVFGENRVVVICLALAAIAAVGYGLAPGLAVVLVFLVINAPEGLVNPLLGAIMSKQVPADAQGEAQGGIASLMSVAMLAGTLFFSYVFGVFTRPNAVVQSPDIAFFVAAALFIVASAMFVAINQRRA